MELTNQHNQSIGVDLTTRTLQTIEYPHHEIHDGNAYFLTYADTIGDAGTIEIRFQTSNTTKWPHMLFAVSSTGETDVDLYEVTPKTHVAANLLTPINRDRNKGMNSEMTFCHTPGGGGDGNLLGEFLYGLDTGTGSKTVIFGGSENIRAELILRQNTAYLLRVTSGTNGNRMTIIFDWYEHRNKVL